MPYAPICILNDLTMPLPLYSPHNFAPVPPLPLLPPPTLATAMSPAPASSLELPLPMLWEPGNAVFKNKYATTVLHRSLGIIQARHDVGILIPHLQVTPAPNNFFTPLHILFSSREMVFSTSTVKVDGVPVGLGGVAGSPPTPMLVCAEPVPFPLGEVTTRWQNTVWVGFTWLDFLVGTLTAIGLMLIEHVLAAKSGKWRNGKKKPAGGALADIAETNRGALGAAIHKKLFPLVKGPGRMTELSKQAAAAVVGLVKVVSTGELDGSIMLGSPYANVTLAVSRNTAGEWTASVTGQMPTVAMSAAVSEARPPSMKVTCNWGSGSATGESTTSESKVSTHNTFRGQTTSQSRLVK